jgi:signal transduction histidine kinase
MATAPRHAETEPLTWRILVAYGVLYVLLDWLSYIHPLFPLAITAWNPPPALSLVLLLGYGSRAWPALFAAAFAAEAIVRDIPLSPLYAAVSSLWLAGGYVLGAHLLQRHLGFDRRFQGLRDLFVFLALIPPLTLVIGMGYVAVYVFAGLIAPEHFLESSLHFWIGDMIGVIVLAPLLLVHGPDLAARSWPRPRAEHWAQGAAILVTLWLIFGLEATDEFKFFYLLFLPLSWVAMRQGVEGATAALLAIQLGLIGALQWRGHLTATVLEFQFLMLALAVTGLFLGMAMSERRRALAALAERETALGQALRAAAVGEMTSALAHELNQPLMAVSNYARASQHLAAELPGSEALRQALDRLVGEVGHAGDVIHRLREYYRYGGLHREALAARPFFEASLESLRQRARRHRIAVTARTEDDVGTVQADPVQLGIVLHNLVSNAIEAIVAAPDCVREIAVHVSRPDRFTLRVCVEDRGPGLDPSQAGELFEPLVSGKSTGMGLGLSICRNLVEGHGGRIWHEARVGGGARFCFTLPILEDEFGSDGLHR